MTRSALSSAILALLVVPLISCPTTVTGLISKPYTSPDVTDADRANYEVTLFTNDVDSGREFLTELGAMGYTNEGNDVLDEPNDNYNIKWGAAPLEVVMELAPSEDRDVTSAEISAMWRDSTPPIPDVVSLAFSATIFTSCFLMPRRGT